VIFLNENRAATIDTLWNRPFVFLNLCCFLTFTNLGLLYLYPLALDAMGNDKHATGWIMGIFSIAAVLSRPFFGKLTIRKGEYRVISLGLLLSLAASLSYNLITAFNPLLFIRVVHGVGFSAFIAGSFSLLAREISPLKRGAAFSMVGVSIMAAIALAPTIGEAVISRYGFHGLYMAAALSVALAWVALAIGLRPAPSMSQAGDGTGVKYLPLLRNRPFLFLLCSTLIFAHSQATVANFLALIAAQNDASSGRVCFLANFTAKIIIISFGNAN
jgi:MFS family permease